MKYVNAYESYTWFENNSEKENQRKYVEMCVNVFKMLKN